MPEPQLRKEFRRELCRDLPRRDCNRVAKTVRGELERRDRHTERRLDEEAGEALASCRVRKLKPCPPRLNRSVVPVLPPGYKQSFIQRKDRPVSSNRRITSPQGKVLRSYAAVRRAEGKLDCLPVPVAARAGVIERSTPSQGEYTSRFAYHRDVPRSLRYGKKKSRKERKERRPIEEEPEPKLTEPSVEETFEVEETVEPSFKFEEAEESRPSFRPSPRSVGPSPRSLRPSPRSVRPSPNLPLQASPQRRVTASFQAPTAQPRFETTSEPAYKGWGKARPSRQPDLPQMQELVKQLERGAQRPTSGTSVASTIYQGWRQLAKDLLQRAERSADALDADTVDRVAHELGPYYESSAESEMSDIEADIQEAQQELVTAQQTFAESSNDAIKKHLKNLNV